MEPSTQIIEFAQRAWAFLKTVPCDNYLATTEEPKIIVEPGFCRKHYVAGQTWRGMRKIVIYLQAKETTDKHTVFHELLHHRGFPHGKYEFGHFHTNTFFDKATPELMRRAGMGNEVCDKLYCAQPDMSNKQSYKKGFSCTHFGRNHQWVDRGNYWKCSNTDCNSTKTKPKELQSRYLFG